MAGKLGNLIVSIGANTGNLKRGLKRAGSMVKGFGSKMKSTAGGMARGAGRAVGTVGAAAGLGGGLLSTAGMMKASKKYSAVYNNAQTKLSYTMERLQMALANKIGPILAKILDWMNWFMKLFVGDGGAAMPVNTPELIFQQHFATSGATQRNP